MLSKLGFHGVPISSAVALIIVLATTLGPRVNAAIQPVSQAATFTAQR